MKKRLVAMLMVTAMTLSLVACGGSSSTTTESATTESGEETTVVADGDKDLIIGCAVDIITNDPGRAYEIYAGTVINACYDTLFRFESDSDVPQNNLVTSYEFSEDGLTCTMQLVENATFSSGNALTSADVAFSLMRLKNLQDNPSFIMDTVDSIDTDGDYTVIFNLNTADSALISKLTYVATAILDSAAVIELGGTDADDAASADTATTALDAASYGSGPYILESYTPDAEIVLVRNENYWGDTAPYADSYTIQVMDDANTQMMAVAQGDIDIAMNLSLDTIGELATTEGVTIDSQSTMTMVFMYLNMNDEYGAVSDPLVQEAIRLAIDYEGILTIAGEGSITPASVVQVGFDGSLGESTRERDVEAALALMEEAGYADGLEIDFPVTTLSAEGIPLTDIAQKLAADLSEIGITLNLETIDWNGGYSDMYRDGTMGATVMYWSPDYQDAVSQLEFAPGGIVALRAGWTEDMASELAALADEIAIETDATTKAELLIELQEGIEEEGPFITLFQCPKHFAYATGLSGVNYSDSYRLDLREVTAE
ncbi:MAG: ABC transporter substrate-binding protein [Eubacteriales bacterium]